MSSNITFSEVARFVNQNRELLSLEEYDLALDYLQLALQIARDIGDTHSEMRHREIQMDIYQYTGRYELALEAGKDAIRLADIVGDDEGKTYFVSQVAEIAKKTKSG